MPDEKHTLSQFELRQIDRAPTNLQITPRDSLRLALHDIDEGLIKPDSLIIIALTNQADGSRDVSMYRANLRRDQEILALDVAHHTAIKRWIGE